ncbi:MAG TPA: HYR domain-containing protein, partial [Gaiellaceae bacterium]|nr:HYR domain-containing protein [Gaiellaceae bacterium]
GARNATINFSSQSDDPTFDHVAIHNVTVDVIDNDTAGVVVTESGGGTTVLPGAEGQGIVDAYRIAPTMAPSVGKTATITISFDSTVLSVTTTDPRYNAATQTATFDSTNWTTPVTFVVTAICPPGPPVDTAIVNTVGGTDPRYRNYGSAHAPTDVRVSVLVSDTPHAYIVESGLSTLVVKGDPAGDIYSVRLTAPPVGGLPAIKVERGGQMTVAIVTDGQTLASAADPSDGRFSTENGIVAFVTFDSTNWYLPFFVRLTANPEPPATDSFQPVKALTAEPPPDPDIPAPTFQWAVAPSRPDLSSIDAPPAAGQRSLDALLCTDVGNQEDHAAGNPQDFSHADHFGCNTVPERQPIILPNERGAGVPPRIDGELLPAIFIEATSRDGAPAVFPTTLPVTGDVGRVTYTFTPGPGTILPFGRSQVSVVAMDEGGNYTTLTLTVIVRDTTPPVITAPNMVVEATNPGGAFVDFAASATDAVGPVELSYSIPSGSLIPLGTTTVTVTATDEAGNTSTKTFLVKVRDTTAPVFRFVSPDLVVEATSAAGAVVKFQPASVYDAVGPVTITYSVQPGSTFGLGTTRVTVTATDGAGNTTKASFTVTVKDTTPPVIRSVSQDLTVEATSAAGAVVSYAAAVATDAVGPVTITYSKPSGATFGLGTTIVTVTAKDGAGNRTTKTFTITVVDRTPPTFTFVSPSLVVTATNSDGAVVKYAAAKATDAVGPVTITYSIPSGSFFALGTTTVIVTATDAFGNVTRTTFTVTVRGKQPS